MSTLSFAGRAWRACTVGLIVSIMGCLEFNSGDGALVEEVASRPSDVEPSDLVDMPEGFLFEPIQRYPLPICGDGEGRQLAVHHTFSYVCTSVFVHLGTCRKIIRATQSHLALAWT